jgi:uncharacterized protein (DUF2267 family)
VQITKLRTAAVFGLGVGVLAWRRSRHAVRHAPDEVTRRLGRRARYLRGRWEGVRYRLKGGHPDYEVNDGVLADRVRTELGSVTRRIDVPRVNVTVEHGTAVLHGEVASAGDAKAVEAAAARVPGVRGVRSELHIGFHQDDARPSKGRARPERSEAFKTLVSAAREAGAGVEAEKAVEAVLGTLVGRLPKDEREHFVTHLPADVRDRIRPRPGADEIRTVTELARAVAAGAPVSTEQAERITRRVFGSLRQLVPEEVDHVAAVLPAELQRFWDAA